MQHYYWNDGVAAAADDDVVDDEEGHCHGVSRLHSLIWDDCFVVDHRLDCCMKRGSFSIIVIIRRTLKFDNNAIPSRGLADNGTARKEC